MQLPYPARPARPRARESHATKADPMEQPHPVRGITFDTAPIAQELRGETAYEREGHTARTLVREPDLRIVLMVMKAGAVIKEHRVKETASLCTLSGHVRLRMGDRLVDLPSGRLLMLERDLQHNVEAVDESSVLLTLGGPET